jgi:glutaminyl-peptide cyclotransferase
MYFTERMFDNAVYAYFGKQPCPNPLSLSKKMYRPIRPGYLIFPLLWAACSGGADQPKDATPPPSSIQTLSYQVVNVFPHDTSAFTEGLELHDSVMFESEGNYGESGLVAYRLRDGKILTSRKLEKAYFGEGITVLGDNLYQLTYKEHAFFVYHYPDLTLLKAGDWLHDGWGMTNDGKHLIADDGTDKLYWIDPQTLKETGRLSVVDESGPLDNLNELEYVDGQLYANRWHTNKIYRIDLHTGRVTGILNLEDLYAQAGLEYQPGDNEDVLNGIAYDPHSKTFIVTGKDWPKSFQIRVY